MGIALVSVAVTAMAVAPAFGQRGGRRGRGASAEEAGGQGGSPGGARGRGGNRVMGGAPGQFPGGGPQPGMFPGRGGAAPGMFPGEGGPQGGFRGRGGAPSGDMGGRGRGGRGPFGGGDSGEGLDRFLREMDADGDGRIEENEVDGRRRNMVEMMAQRAGIPPTFPIPVNRLRDAMNNRAGQGQGGANSTSSGEGGAKKPTEEPLVPGFGVELDLSAVLSFGQRPDSRAAGKTRTAVVSASRSSSSSSSSSSQAGSNADRMRRGAEAMIRQADRNGNGRLERNEWNDRWGDFDEADRDHRGAVDADELAQRLSGFARGGPGGDGGGGGGSSGSGTPPQPKSYRVPTPTELLPPGLPDWFAQKDANADGQVAMAEYESPRSWTAAAVAEFTRFDLNNDGFITPTECLSTLNQAGAGGQLASAGAPRQALEAAPAGPPPGPGSNGRPSGQASRADQGRAMFGARGRGQQSDRFSGMPGPRGRGSQPSRRAPSGTTPGGDRGSQAPRGGTSGTPPGGGGVDDPWAGFQ
jgi:Ca2+-binding EF-hand superfamily protein